MSHSDSHVLHTTALASVKGLFRAVQVKCILLNKGLSVVRDDFGRKKGGVMYPGP
jgi:hypothetical protein